MPTEEWAVLKNVTESHFFKVTDVVISVCCIPFYYDFIEDIWESQLCAIRMLFLGFYNKLCPDKLSGGVFILANTLFFYFKTPCC